MPQLNSEILPGNKKVLFCVLNWGLGHASRSIPIIKALIERGNSVEIASDGIPLEMLRKAFPDLRCHELPDYKIRYPFPSILLNMIFQSLRIIYTIRKEHKAVKKLFDKCAYDFIISDNRPGCYHKEASSVLITHQTSPYHSSGLVRYLFKIVSRFYFQPFDRLWIPDDENIRLSGSLSNYAYRHPPVEFLGLCSRVKPGNAIRTNSIAVILSGPEPQRTFLEKRLLDILKSVTNYTIYWVRGGSELTPLGDVPPHMHVTALADQEEINRLLSTSALVICRSGYTSLMDIAVSGCNALLVPTPGQSEQEYLAALHQDRWPYSRQSDLAWADIEKALANL